MKIILAHTVHSLNIDKWYKSIARAVPEGLEITPFCITLDPPGPRLTWNDLDKAWNVRDKKLITMYRQLQKLASQNDVLISYNGANIHPELLEYLPTFNVYCCFDDPESSHDLSAPVAKYFDAVFFGNIASRFQYESWGCKKIAYLPVFTAPEDVPSPHMRENLFLSHRTNDIILCCERESPWRQKRLDALAQAFPQSLCYGRGWTKGILENKKLDEIYRNSKIGWNIHNSTGPINRRFFTLPAYGILQICDNKTGAGQIFELGKEIIGFNTIHEAIEFTSYYLEHEDERQEIAKKGYERYWKDYHAGAIWDRIIINLKNWGVDNSYTSSRTVSDLPESSISTRCFKKIYYTARKLYRYVARVKGSLHSLYKPHIKTQFFDESVPLGRKVHAYHENCEMAGVNMVVKRLADGMPLDWPNILALNWAVTTLIRNEKNIIEIGSGTGPFAEYASIDKSRTIHCVEPDNNARNIAKEIRSFNNVTFYQKIEDTGCREYDLLVANEVIEHIDNLFSFLSLCQKLSSRAIYTTPNRIIVRGDNDIGPPAYEPHVREFSPGEIYWILKQFYKEVFLYYMPDVHVPWLCPMNIATHGTPIIADCTEPIITSLL